MIYTEPELTPADLHVLDLIEDQREKLSLHTMRNPRKWTGSLRKATLARAIRGSNSIEGYNATLNDVLAAADGMPVDDTDTSKAISGYQMAMTYILQASQDPSFEVDTQLLKSLHFMMIHWDINKGPGLWRTREIFVVDDRVSEPVYRAPDYEQINDLMGELVEYVRAPSEKSIMVTAAMAHLNMTMIHPFSDGNGRMARALQTLVLARDGLVNPIFSSIEEWLGEHTNEYYGALEKMSDGNWAPQINTSSWVKFCLKAHYKQAARIIRRNEEYEALYERIEKLASTRGLHERSILPLFDVATGMQMTNAGYQAAADVSIHIATRDLKALTETGLLEPHGEKRGRYYTGSAEILKHRLETRIRRPIPDPYEAFGDTARPPGP